MKRFNYSQLAQTMTREEIIVLQLRKQAQEAIDRAYYDGMKKIEGMYPTSAEREMSGS